MIIISGKDIYKCEFCKKKYLVKSACEKHELFCPKNPKNFKACSGCIHLKGEKIDAWVDFLGRETHIKLSGFRCSKKNQLLYPLKAERLNLPNRFPETFENQQPMPKECDVFDDGFNDIFDF